MLTNAELQAILRQHETGNLERLLSDKEGFIQYCVQAGYLEEIPDQEQVVSVLKSELAMRGMFD